MVRRRDVLTTISAFGVGGLAGCTDNSGSGDGSGEGSDADEDTETCIEDPIEVLSTEVTLDNCAAAEVKLTIQNQADVEASYTIIVEFGTEATSETDEVEKSGTLDGKLTDVVAFKGYKAGDYSGCVNDYSILSVDSECTTG